MEVKSRLALDWGVLNVIGVTAGSAVLGDAGVLVGGFDMFRGSCVGPERGKVQCGEFWVPAPGYGRAKPRGVLAWRWHPGPKAIYGCSFPLSERSCFRLRQELAGRV